MRRGRQLLILALLPLLAACASSSTREEQPKPVIKTIWVVPVSEPTIAVSGGGTKFSDFSPSIVPVVVGAAVGINYGAAAGKNARTRADARATEQTALLGAVLADSKLQLAADMTEIITAALKQQGFLVETLPTEFLGPPKDPQDLKYAQIKQHADAVLFLNIRDSTLHEYRAATGHEPRLNITVELIRPHTEAELFAADYYYGEDASRDKKRHFKATRECIFPSLTDDAAFGAALAQCFRGGAQLMAQTAATDLTQALR